MNERVESSPALVTRVVPHVDVATDPEPGKGGRPYGLMSDYDLLRLPEPKTLKDAEVVGVYQQESLEIEIDDAVTYTVDRIPDKDEERVQWVVNALKSCPSDVHSQHVIDALEARTVEAGMPTSEFHAIARLGFEKFTTEREKSAHARKRGHVLLRSLRLASRLGRLRSRDR